MAAIEKPKIKEYDYGDVLISLENCILPDERLSETPSMKDGLDKETETDLRVLGCEFIQTAGILLKLPQVAMATGQILLQRFYYSKSLVKHDVEIYAMACIFLAAKIEESPRRLRDIINVFHHIKQKRSRRTVTPMDYFSNAYFGLKNNVIKAERRVLKELGFCVHVKHPHKVIITYLQILEHEKNSVLAQRAWNYMSDSLRTDVFLRYAPEKIGCACIFLAARFVKVVLPLRPPWWELFDVDMDDIEEISLTIMKLYARPKVKMSKLDEAIESAKKLLQDKKDVSKENGSVGTPGSFTPVHASQTATIALGTKQNTSPAKVSPADKESTKGSSRDSDERRRSSKRSEERARKRPANRSRSRSPTPPRRKNARAGSESPERSSSESPSAERKRKSKKNSRPRNSYSSSDSEDDGRRGKTKDRRNDMGNKQKPKFGRENGQRSYDYDRRYERRSRSRSRSRERVDKKYDKRREKEKKRDERVRYDEREYRNTYDRYDKKVRR